MTQSLQRCPTLSEVLLRQAHDCANSYKRHSHDEFSFGRVDAGQAYYQKGRQEDRIGAGVLVGFDPGEVHACNPDNGIWSYRMVFLSTHWVHQLQQESDDFACQDYIGFKSDLTACPDTFDRLYQQLQHSTDALSSEIELIEFLRPCWADQRPTRTYRADQALGRAHDCLMSQLTTPPDLATLSREANRSRDQLIIDFKRRYGLPPHAYLLDQRIRRARQLLSQGWSIIDTAQSLGFADQAHFQRHFKQRTAMTPRQYQQAHRGHSMPGYSRHRYLPEERSSQERSSQRHAPQGHSLHSLLFQEPA